MRLTAVMGSLYQTHRFKHTLDSRPRLSCLLSGIQCLKSSSPQDVCVCVCVCVYVVYEDTNLYNAMGMT